MDAWRIQVLLLLISHSMLFQAVLLRDCLTAEPSRNELLLTGQRQV